jgi:hypothetical protein
MKTIRIQISDDSVTSATISELDKQIEESTRISAEFKIIYSQVIACIEDFSAKAKKLANAGTTIHIQREFKLPGVQILIALDYPKRTKGTSFLEKLRGIFDGIK